MSDPTTPSRETLRDRRHRVVRSRVENMARLPKFRLRLLAAEADEDLAEAGVVHPPQTRGDCVDAPRPCPFVSCKWHLYLDVHPRTGSVKLNFPDIDVAEMSESCALDVADRGGETLESLGEIFNVTRERIRQLEGLAIDHLTPEQRAILAEYCDDDERTRR